MIETKYPHGEDFPVVKVNTAFCEAEVSLYGGHLMSWIPTGQKPIFFMSEQSVFRKGKALRGGVPICWPWFGKHPSDPAQPSHGLARIGMWKLEEATENEEEVRLGLCFEAPELQLRATYHLVIQRDSLYATLATQYTGFEPLPYSAALHNYFAVSDNEHVAITGLEETPFIEFASEPVAHSEDPLVPTGPIDRIYHPVQADQLVTLHDPGWNRSLEIVRRGSSSCVVWNPGEAGAACMADLGVEQAHAFVAVEPTVVPAEGLTLRHGEEHVLAMWVKVVPVR